MIRSKTNATTGRALKNDETAEEDYQVFDSDDVFRLLEFTRTRKWLKIKGGSLKLDFSIGVTDDQLYEFSDYMSKASRPKDRSVTTNNFAIEYAKERRNRQKRMRHRKREAWENIRAEDLYDQRKTEDLSKRR